MTDHAQCKNTDREIWRGPDEGNGSYYADSIHVTDGGGIGINCGGHVIVKPLRDWHALAAIGTPGSAHAYHAGEGVSEPGSTHQPQRWLERAKTTQCCDPVIDGLIASAIEIISAHQPHRALRAHRGDARELSEQQRHAIEHARYQVKHATPDDPECCFDYQLVETLLDIIDAHQPQGGDALAKAREALKPFALNPGAVSLSKALGHISRDHLLAAKDALLALEAEPAQLADRLSDIIMMLDAPDAYAREYIAAVCRATLSTVQAAAEPVAQSDARPMSELEGEAWDRGYSHGLRAAAEPGEMRDTLEAALHYLDNSDSPGGCNGRHKDCGHCQAIAKVRKALRALSPASANAGSGR